MQNQYPHDNVQTCIGHIFYLKLWERGGNCFEGSIKKSGFGINALIEALLHTNEASGERTEIHSKFLFFEMELFKYITLGTILTGTGIYFAWRSFQIKKRKDEFEHKVDLKIFFELKRILPKMIYEFGEPIHLKLHLIINVYNEGGKKALIDKILLMKRNLNGNNIQITELNLQQKKHSREVMVDEPLLLEFRLDENLIFESKEEKENSLFIRIIDSNEKIFNSPIKKFTSK